MARSDGAPSFEKRILCSELVAGKGNVLVEGRWSRIIRVHKLCKKVNNRNVHIGWDIYTDHPDYSSHHSSIFRQAGVKISVRFWLKSETWEARQS